MGVPVSKIVRRLPMTVACDIGRHGLCDGTGYDHDRNMEVVKCNCVCHHKREKSE